jgi:hypothetical protein
MSNFFMAYFLPSGTQIVNMEGRLMCLLPVGTTLIPVNPVQAAPQGQEQAAVVEITEETQAEGDAFAKEAEAMQMAQRIVDDFGDDDLDDARKGILGELKEGLQTGNVEQVEEGLRRWDFMDEVDAEEDRIEEELAHCAQLLEEDKAHVAQVQGAESKMDELKKLFLKLIELNNKQMPLYKACIKMRKELKIQREIEEAKGKRAGRRYGDSSYWPTWNKVIAIQKEWLATHEALRALEGEVAASDKEFDFQTLAVEWNPDKEFKGNYKQLYKVIVDNFTRNIESDKALQERGRAMGEKPAAMLSDFVGAVFEREAAKEPGRWRKAVAGYAAAESGGM